MMMPTAALLLRHPLRLDRSLRLDVEPSLAPLLAEWAPVAASSSLSELAVPDAADVAVITVTTGGGIRTEPDAEPYVRLGGASCWFDDDRARATLLGVGGACGVVDLVAMRAEITAPVVTTEATGAALRAMCTIAAALLLGRRGSTLVAASAVIAPDGGGWLLVGEASSGKSTTAANLIRSGWSYLADEEVMLHTGARGSVWLEGWPRALALDAGWEDGAMRLRRTSVPPANIGRGRWRRTAPLAGVILTRLAPETRTELTRATPDDALAGLVLATPWLLADRESSRFELGVLRQAARTAAWHLRLGRDTYADNIRLMKCLRPLDAAS